MRALFYHTDREWSGRARVFAAAARVLSERGHQITFACAPESVVEERVAHGDFEVVPVAERGALLRESFRLRRVLQEHFVEVVFVHSEREHLVAAQAARLAERAAVVRRVPAGVGPDVGGRTRFASRLAATGWIFTSEAELRGAPRLPRALEPLVADIGVDAARYDAIRPAAKQTLGSAGAGRVIACVYEPSARQRIATVLRTFALLAPRHPDLRLALVGRGSDQEDLRMHAAALGVTNVVSHLGERDDELAVLKTADVGWVVADGDEAAFAALDLMALRIPVLADRDTVAARYVADGITGTLLPPGDAPATAALLSVVLAHAEQRSAMGSAGRTRVARDFSEREMADQFAAAADLARDRTRWVR